MVLMSFILPRLLPHPCPPPWAGGEGGGVLHVDMSATTRAVHYPPCAGAQIAQHILQSRFFKEAHSVGLYITCERLREVDTTALLDEALQHGKRHEPLDVQEASRQAAQLLLQLSAV